MGSFMKVRLGWAKVGLTPGSWDAEGRHDWGCHRVDTVFTDAQQSPRGGGAGADRAGSRHMQRGTPPTFLWIRLLFSFSFSIPISVSKIQDYVSTL